MTSPHNFTSRTRADTVLAGLDLSDKHILITGANTGIGFETARSLSAAGASVILACRSEERGHAAVVAIKEQHPDASVQFKPLDLSSIASIKAFANALEWRKCDVLIGNAGLVPTAYQETEEGIERCVGVCHFGHFALFKLLLPKLLKSDDPRVVMVSSESHRSPKMLDFDMFPLDESNFSMMKAYGQAKLCNTLFANELQRRYGAQNLSACSLHPGTLVTTDIGRNSGVFNIVMKLISPLTKTANQGAATTVCCAAYLDANSIQGKYFSHCGPVRSSREANSPDVAARLWGLSEAFCEEHSVL